MRTKLILSLIFSILLTGCPKEEEPCLNCPPTDGNDSLSITEIFITQGIHPAISPDGKKLAFSINGDIYICDTTGLMAKQITSGIEYDALPQWHPSGSILGFVRTNQPYSNTAVLCSVDTNGTNSSILIQNYHIADSLLLINSVSAPIWNWSPDGNKLAFLNIVNRITYLRIFSYPNPSEIKSIQVYDSRFYATWAGFSFSPSGNQILFTKMSDEYVTYLFKSSTNSDTTIQQLSAKWDVIYPSWSNLENKISFRYPRFFSILSDNGQVIVEANENVYRNPKWSPNGKYILSEDMMRVGGANGYVFSRLFLTTSDLQKSIALTTTGDWDVVFVHNYFFTWNPDSNIVYYQKYNRIYKITFHYNY